MDTLKKERLLLSKLIKQSKKYEDQKVPILKIEQGLDNYYLTQLLVHNLVYKDYHEQDSEGNEIIDSISISQLGFHFSEWRNENLKKFWIKSILTPIGVSIATTLLVLLLQHLLKQVLKSP